MSLTDSEIKHQREQRELQRQNASNPTTYGKAGRTNDEILYDALKRIAIRDDFELTADIETLTPGVRALVERDATARVQAAAPSPNRITHPTDEPPVEKSWAESRAERYTDAGFTESEAAERASQDEHARGVANIRANEANELSEDEQNAILIDDISNLQKHPVVNAEQIKEKMQFARERGLI